MIISTVETNGVIRHRPAVPGGRTTAAEALMHIMRFVFATAPCFYMSRFELKNRYLPLMDGVSLSINYFGVQVTYNSRSMPIMATAEKCELMVKLLETYPRVCCELDHELNAWIRGSCVQDKNFSRKAFQRRPMDENTYSYVDVHPYYFKNVCL